MAVLRAKIGSADADTYVSDFESGNIDDYFDDVDSFFSLSTEKSYLGLYSLKADVNYTSENIWFYAKKNIALNNTARIIKIEFYFYYNGETNNDHLGLRIFYGSEAQSLINLRKAYDQASERHVFVGGYGAEGSYDTGITLLSNKWIRVTFDNIDVDNNYNIELYNETDGVQLFQDSNLTEFEFSKATAFAFYVQNRAYPYSCYFDKFTIDYVEEGWQRVE